MGPIVECKLYSFGLQLINFRCIILQQGKRTKKKHNTPIKHIKQTHLSLYSSLHLQNSKNTMNSFEEPKTPNNVKNQKNTIFTTPKWPSSRRTHSLSSTSSSISSNSSSSLKSFSNEDSPPPSPPQRIPFSWETIPGIPKHQIIKRIDSLRKSDYLPLPPPMKSNHQKNHMISRKDPFFAALVECSKDDDNDDDDNDNKDVFGSIWKGPAKSLSHRFGFVNLSCKNTCSVSESLVFLPKEQPRRISYGLVKKRSR